MPLSFLFFVFEPFAQLSLSFSLCSCLSASCLFLFFLQTPSSVAAAAGTVSLALWAPAARSLFLPASGRSPPARSFLASNLPEAKSVIRPQPPSFEHLRTCAPGMLFLESLATDFAFRTQVVHRLAHSSAWILIRRQKLPIGRQKLLPLWKRL